MIIMAMVLTIEIMMMPNITFMVVMRMTLVMIVEDDVCNDCDGR